MIIKAKQNHKIALVTGCTAGLGLALMRQLAEKRYRVIGIARSSIKGQRCLEVLRAQTGNPNLHFYAADLSLIKEALAVGHKIAQEFQQVDLVFFNAGGIFMTPSFTPEGIERTFALNHFGTAALALSLNPALEQAKLLLTTSRAHIGVNVYPEDLMSLPQRYNGWTRYQQSKLLNIHLARVLQHSLPPSTTVMATHPGLIKTQFGHNNGWLWHKLWWLLQRFAISADRAAAEMINLIEAQAPRQDGRAQPLYAERGQPATPSTAAQDSALSEAIGQKTEEIISYIASTQQTG